MAIVYYSTHELERQVLGHASQDERLAITQIYTPLAKSALSSKELTSSICEGGGHAVGNWLRSQGVPYSELLHDVAEMLKVDDLQSLKAITSTGLTAAEMDARALNPVLASDAASNCKWQVESYVQRHEQAVLRKFAEDAYRQMSDKQRIQVDKQVRELAGKTPGISMGGLGTSAAFLAAAGVSGFAPYLLLSTVISTVTGGIAGFGVYTAASSALHMLLGPAGWTALGATALYKAGGPNQQKCLKAVLAISLLRGRLEQAAARLAR